MTSTSPVEESTGKAYVCVDRREAGTRAEILGVTEISPTGRLTLWDQREAGTWVHRSRKEARSGTTDRSPTVKAYVVGQRGSWDSGVQIWDGRCCERTLSVLPTDVVCGTIKVYVLYVYSTEPVTQC